MVATPMIPPVGKRKLDLVGVYVTSELKKELEKWAEEEQRSVSNLAAILLSEAVKQRNDSRQGNSEKS